MHILIYIQPNIFETSNTCTLSWIDIIWLCINLLYQNFSVISSFIRHFLNDLIVSQLKTTCILDVVGNTCIYKLTQKELKQNHYWRVFYSTDYYRFKFHYIWWVFHTSIIQMLFTTHRFVTGTPPIFLTGCRKTLCHLVKNPRHQCCLKWGEVGTWVHILYTGSFSPSVFFALLNLQRISPHLQFAQTGLF